MATSDTTSFPANSSHESPSMSFFYGIVCILEIFLRNLHVETLLPLSYVLGGKEGSVCPSAMWATGFRSPTPESRQHSEVQTDWCLAGECSCSITNRPKYSFIYDQSYHYTFLTLSCHGTESVPLSATPPRAGRAPAFCGVIVSNGAVHIVRVRRYPPECRWPHMCGIQQW